MVFSHIFSSSYSVCRHYAYGGSYEYMQLSTTINLKINVEYTLKSALPASCQIFHLDAVNPQANIGLLIRVLLGQSKNEH